jgi:hypothetical protein
VDLVLVDWTRMGKTYCLAGAVAQDGGYHVVRPMPSRGKNVVAANVGWSPWLMDGHSRWEIFQLVDPLPVPSEPPHTEDLWVRGLRPRRLLAAPSQRRAILNATSVTPGNSLFGEPLVGMRALAYLPAGRGKRSLTTLVVPSRNIVFAASRRAGVAETDFRVTLPIPELGDRSLAMKDHHLLVRAARASEQVQEQVKALDEIVRQMGEQVAIRLGLSRPFQSVADREPAVCWLMADGFFSFSDPQP